MFIYSKREFFPIDIKKKDLKMAKALYAQYGGPYGELGADILLKELLCLMKEVGCY